MKVLDKISPKGRLSKLHILIYHRVLAQFDPLRPTEITSQRFEQHLNILKRHFNVLNLSEAYHRLLEGTLPPNAVCITFDDGYQDNLDCALPLLKAYDCSASFFIATGFMQQGMMFNDAIIESIRDYHQPLNFDGVSFDCEHLLGKSQAIEALINKIKPLPLGKRQEALTQYLPGCQKSLPRMMMTEHGVRALDRAGMHIGAHTVHHPLLSQVSPDVAFEEIGQSKQSLEDILQKPIHWFAYPNGKWKNDFNQQHIDMLKKLKFTGALATDWGIANRDTNPFKLPRFTPWQTSSLKFMTKMLTMRYLCL